MNWNSAACAHKVLGQRQEERHNVKKKKDTIETPSRGVQHKAGTAVSRAARAHPLPTPPAAHPQPVRCAG